MTHNDLFHEPLPATSTRADVINLSVSVISIFIFYSLKRQLTTINKCAIQWSSRICNATRTTVTLTTIHIYADKNDKVMKMIKQLAEQHC